MNGKLNLKYYDSGKKYFVPTGENSGIFYNPDGKKIYEGIIRNWNILSGDNFISYYQNGQKKSKGSYVDGCLDGFAIIYNTKGIKIFEGEYKCGKRNGKGILFDPETGVKKEQGIFGGVNEELVEGVKFYPNGEKNEEGTFVRKKLDNLGTVYYPNGKKMCEGIFWEGELNGHGKYYDYRGEMIYEGDFKNGYPRDFENFSRYYLNGVLRFKGNIKNFKKNGHGIEYIPTDHLYVGTQSELKFFEGEYSNGEKLEGIEFYPSGNNHYEGKFEMGKIKEGKEYSPDGKICYEGEFYSGLPKEAKNICIYYSNGFIKFEGSFKNGKYEGYGILYHEPEKNYSFPYGKGKNIIYEGNFCVGEMHGEGTIYDCYGAAKTGKFVYGELE